MQTLSDGKYYGISVFLSCTSNLNSITIEVDSVLMNVEGSKYFPVRTKTEVLGGKSVFVSLLVI